MPSPEKLSMATGTLFSAITASWPLHPMVTMRIGSASIAVEP